MASTRKWIVAFLKLAVTVLLCVLIAGSLDFASFAETVTNVDAIYLVVPCLLYPVSLLISAIKLNWLLGGYQLRISTSDSFDVNWIGAFFNNFLPSSVGGDVYRLMYLNRSYPDKPGQIVSAIILDRGLGLLAVLIVAGLAGIVFVGDLVSSALLIAGLYLVAVLIGLAAFLVFFFRHGVQIALTTRSATVNKVINGINILIRFPDKAGLTRSLAISLLQLSLVVLSYAFLFRAFGSTVPLSVLLFAIPVVILAAMIPISINAIGVTEGAGIVLFAHFGFGSELVLSAFLTGRVLLILCSATGGVRLLFRRNPI